MNINIIFFKYTHKKKFFCTNTFSIIKDNDILSYIASFNQNYIITKTNDLYAYGLNRNGQLGLGNTDDFITKFQKNSFFSKNVILVAIGMRHCIFMTNEIINNIYSSGCNMYGQLGINIISQTSVPRQININKKIIKVACGIEHTLLLTDENINNLYGFGNNFNSQLGVFGKIEYDLPINIQTMSKVANIDCSQHTSVYLDWNKNMYIFGIYKKNVYKYPTLININKNVIAFNINYSDLFFITSEKINNLYVWNTQKLTQNILPTTLIVSITKQNETIICVDSENNYYYYGDVPLFINNNSSNMVYNNPNILLKDKNKVLSNINCRSSYISYNDANNSINNSIVISVEDNVEDEDFRNVININSYFKIIKFSPEGTTFSDYIDLTLYPILQSDNYKLYFISKNDPFPTKLENTDDGYGAYYQLDKTNGYKIFTKHFSKACAVLDTVTNIKYIPPQHWYTHTYNKIDLTIESNYMEEYYITVTKIINLHNKKIMNVFSSVNGTSVTFNSQYEFCGLVQLEIRAINYQKIFNGEFRVYFYNRIKVRKKYIINKNNILKLDIGSSLCNVTYNKKKIKLKHTHNKIILYPNNETITNIYFFTKLYKIKLKIIVQ
jgi:hypothetical protein